MAATGLLRAAFKLALSHWHLWLSLQPEATMPRMLHWQLRQWAPNEAAPARGNRAARPACRHGDATHEAAALCRVATLYVTVCKWFMLFMTLDMPDEGTR